LLIVEIFYLKVFIMPELPEVETVVRGLRSVAKDYDVAYLKFYRKDLRQPIPIKDLKNILLSHKLQQISRRAKYILMETINGWAIVHLGMSGRFICLPSSKPQFAHTHMVMGLSQKTQKPTLYLHYIDPRRFGVICAQKASEPLDKHRCFSHLGVEPLDCRNLANILWEKGLKSKRSIKALIMDAEVVVGVGNIYACEALFTAGIHPQSPANFLTKPKYTKLAAEIKKVLRNAIKKGGTTLKDFRSSDNNSGYFQLQLKVYGREDQACSVCKTKIIRIAQAGRSSWYCKNCQKLAK
jgi:formamidopyrimidine-DNA glycosylase